MKPREDLDECDIHALLVLLGFALELGAQRLGDVTDHAAFVWARAMGCGERAALKFAVHVHDLRP